MNDAILPITDVVGDRRPGLDRAPVVGQQVHLVHPQAVDHRADVGRPAGISRYPDRSAGVDDSPAPRTS